MPRKAGSSLTRAVVVQTAARLINAEGAEGITLGKLAAELGVQAPSLYNHVDGLPDLFRELALLNARALGERMSEAVMGKSGRAAVMAAAQAYRGYIKENANLYLSSLRASRNQPAFDEELAAAEDRAVKASLAVLVSFGLHGDDALHAVRGLRSLVHGFTTLEVAGGFGLALDCDESFHRLVEVWVSGLEQSLKPA